MNSLRTNETRKISDLISPALLQALGPNVTNNFAAPKSRNTFKAKVEEVDPVRSAERVPYNRPNEQFERASSHQLSSLSSLPAAAQASLRQAGARNDSNNVAAA